MGRNMDIEIPADAKTVTLELEKRCSFTLRTLLPQVKDRVEPMIEDYFYGGEHELGADVYRPEADNGEKLMKKLTRSRDVEGEFLLDLVPEVRSREPRTILGNGSYAMYTDPGCIQLWVRVPAPDEEGQ